MTKMEFCGQGLQFKDLLALNLAMLESESQRNFQSNNGEIHVGKRKDRRLAGHAKFETTRQFYLAVRPDAIDRARLASEASRKGNSVAHLLLAPSESDQQERLQRISASKP